MNPVRKSTIAGTAKKYEFDLDVTQFLVKNLTDGDIEVRLEETGEDVWLIPGADNQSSHNSLYVKASETSDRGVEVEAVKYRLLRRC